ncbi:DUF305 domain-containing protein [Siculibacillus lacustris]|uniref:DUF305 domain-containing protein n=1 Tax=Siculibacillus lacustris TaxID=1549641 RepID=UPI0013F15DDB|nr:DUF305 domain-containing protein [Siculibacillus lacustris]
MTAAIIASLLAMEGMHFAQMWGTPAPVAVRDPAGRELDRQFVQALISRYKDTLALADKERVQGHNPELRRLAEALVEARRRELASIERFVPDDQ